MKKITDLNKANISEEDLEKGMKDLMNDKFNSELRAKYADKLKEEYQIERLETEQNQDADSRPEKSKTNFLLPLLLIAVMAIGAFLIGKLKKSPTESRQDKIHQIMASNEIPYLETSRNESDINQIRNEASTSYEQKNYQQAISSFQKIENKTISDQFFLAYSYFKTEDYQNSSLEFEKLLTTFENQDQYLPESRLFKIISLLKINKNEEAKKAYEALPPNSWAKQKLSTIF